MNIPHVVGPREVAGIFFEHLCFDPPNVPFPLTDEMTTHAPGPGSCSSVSHHEKDRVRAYETANKSWCHSMFEGVKGCEYTSSMSLYELSARAEHGRIQEMITLWL